MIEGNDIKAEQTVSSFTIQKPEDTSITFYGGNEPVIKITKDGLFYKGEFVPDAGEVHRLMVSFLREYKR